MKKLHEFTIEKEEEVVEEEVVHEDDGSTTTKSKKIKKFVPQKFFIKKPSHSLMDDASLYYGVELARAVKAGMLTESMLRKRFEEDGGILSKQELKQYEKLYDDLRKVVEEVAKVETSTKTTKAQKNKLQKLEEKKNDILSEIQQFETQRSTLFNQTAENRARTKLITWWVIKLAGETKDENDLMLWDTHEDDSENLKKYNEWYEENVSLFDSELKLKFLYYISFWFNSSSNDSESFKEIAKQADEEIAKELGVERT